MRRVLFFSFLVLASEASYGFCLAPPTKLCKVLFADDVAAHVKVESLRYLVEPDDPEGISGWLYHLKIIKAYRGKIGATLDVMSENTTSRVALEVGKEYFVFTSQNVNGIYEAGNSCDDYSGEEYSPAKEAAIEALLKVKTSSLEGGVVGQGPTPIAGVTIRFVGGGKDYVATSDAKGTFAVTVPPGRYRIVPPQGFRNSGISQHFTDSPDVSVVAGECAQFQFEQWPQK